MKPTTRSERMALAAAIILAVITLAALAILVRA